jgi:hypothetical protein
MPPQTGRSGGGERPLSAWPPAEPSADGGPSKINIVVNLLKGLKQSLPVKQYLILFPGLVGINVDI